MNPWILEFHGQEKKRKEKENEERSEIEKKKQMKQFIFIRNGGKTHGFLVLIPTPQSLLRKIATD